MFVRVRCRRRQGEIQRPVKEYYQLYSVDLLFWQIVQKKYNRYRQNVLDNFIGSRYSDNWGEVYSVGEYGIWLCDGWHQPQVDAGRVVTWAGPNSRSDIYIKRDVKHSYLTFSVVVFCGISENEIKVLDVGGLELPILSSSKCGSEIKYAVEIVGQELTCSLTLLLPRSWSPVMVDKNSSDFERRTIAISDWCLVEKIPTDSLW